MIIDIHGHTNAPPSLYAYKSEPVIEAISSLSEQDKKNIFEDVPKKVFPRFKS